MHLSFELLNVFAVEGDPFSGNPLCVVTGAEGLSDAAMQRWARQFNLSETTFVTGRVDAGEASVRIFTPGHEMPFAGHPTLGTAEVVAGLASAAGGSAPEQVHLTMPAGRIPVRRVPGGWRLDAPAATTRTVSASAADLAGTLGLDPAAVCEASWADAGVEQLLVRLRSAQDVRACVADPRLMHEHMTSPGRPPHVYVWAWTGPATVEARLFFTQDASVVEDPATGSACANLGGWLAAQGHRDVVVHVHQGAAVARPSVLVLELDADGGVHVGGRVERVGSGVLAGVLGGEGR